LALSTDEIYGEEDASLFNDDTRLLEDARSLNLAKLLIEVGLGLFNLEKLVIELGLGLGSGLLPHLLLYLRDADTIEPTSKTPTIINEKLKASLDIFIIYKK